VVNTNPFPESTALDVDPGNDSDDSDLDSDVELDFKKRPSSSSTGSKGMYKKVKKMSHRSKDEQCRDILDGGTQDISQEVKC
jgi:hypothetical protein